MESSNQLSRVDGDRRQRAIQQVLWVTLALNLLVFGVKVLLGLTTGALSLLADALHSFTDSASNVVGLVAMKWADPKPDWDHPYGHGKFEAVAALGIAAFLGIACFEIVQSAIIRIVTPSEAIELNVDTLSLKLTIGVLIANIGVAVYERWRGQALNSRLLLADARHTFSDIWITTTVLAGLWGIQQGWLWLDTALAFPVAGLVLWSAWEVLKENIPYLTDRVAIAPRVIYETAMGVSGVLNCHAITSRGIVGQLVFVEMHLVVEPPDVQSAHQITETIERLLQERYGTIRTTIHVEPSDYIEPFEAMNQFERG